jgi:hypothetical protein
LPSGCHAWAPSLNSLSSLSFLSSFRGALQFYHDDYSLPLCTLSGSGSYGYLNSLALIGPLGDDGGPTQTHALLPGSNAIDTGDSVAGCIGPNSLPLPTDQRGALRTVDGDQNGTAICDIGAFEVQPPLFLPLLLR